MINKMNFKEVSLEKIEGNETLPGDIYTKDIELSDEETAVILEEMSHYYLKHIQEYSYINWEHSECNESSTDTFARRLQDLENYYFEPIYLVKDKHFYGVSVAITRDDRATFLVSGQSYGRTETHENTTFGHVDKDNDNYYSMERINR